MYIKWLTFSCDLPSLYPAVHLLSMWLSGIISTLQVFIVLSMKFMILSDILYICRLIIIQLCGTISYAFF